MPTHYMIIRFHRRQLNLPERINRHQKQGNFVKIGEIVVLKSIGSLKAVNPAH